MANPITIDIPHTLGKQAVRQRLEGGVNQVVDKIPGGGKVDHRWDGDTMHFSVQAMGQTIASSATVFENKVHAVVDLPGILGLFAGKIRGVIEREAPKLLK